MPGLEVIRFNRGSVGHGQLLVGGRILGQRGDRLGRLGLFVVLADPAFVLAGGPVP
ncbi:hypothetical protein D3C71_2108960 [compost metagenome]